MQPIERHKDKIKALCERHHVERLYAFGSVAAGSLAEESDIDFLVKFGNVNSLNYFDNYMDFKESLEELFQREVDLVEEQAVENPIFKQSIDETKRLIYGQPDSEMAL